MRLDNIAIVVPAYNRAAPLRRLLDSLLRMDLAGYQSATLVISIDRSDNPEVATLAESFEWTLGEKRVLLRPERLGLRRHILACGDLTAEFGAVMVLEDDLLVSPAALHWTRAALEAYDDDDRVAGVSLYAYDYNEFASLPFAPLADGYDNYFCQVPSSWGQVWTRSQWAGFRRFLENTPNIPADAPLPATVLSWPESSWKKHYMHYLATTGRWFVFPRTALSTNFGDVGTHYALPSNRHQVPLQLGRPAYRLSRLADSLARYDAHFEPDPAVLKQLNPALRSFEFETDFYGKRPVLPSSPSLRLSSRPHPSPIATFGLRMQPLEANVIHAVQGDFLSLGTTRGFHEMSSYRRAQAIRAVLKCDVSPLENEIAAKVRSTRSYRLGATLLRPLQGTRAS